MRRHLISIFAMGALLAAGFALQPSVAQNAPTPDMIALTSQKDTTLARRLLMNSIGANHDIVKDILNGTLPADDLELRGRLESIGAMLFAMPSLYRAEPNPYTEEAEQADALHVSLASEALWEEFETFNLRSQEAFNKANEAAEAPADQIAERVQELQVMCDSCHEAYRKPFEYFNFDNLEDQVK